MNVGTFLGQAKTLVLVAFLTSLVWLMAEAESLRTEKLRPEIHFRVKPDTPRLVKVEPGQDFSGTVTITIEGPTAAIDAVVARARSIIDLEPGMDGVPAEAGRHTINLTEALRSLPLFRENGINVTMVDPASATIAVDDLVVEQAIVKVETPEGALLDGNPEPHPPTVSVRLPGRVAKTIPVGDLIATARLSPESLFNLPEGSRVAVATPVTLPASIQGDVLRVSPAQVSVELTLRSKAASITVQNIPVLVRVAPTDVGVWDVDLAPENRVLQDVTVTGPAELIDQVRTSMKLTASVSLSFEELDRAASSGKPIEKEVSLCDVPSLLKFEPHPRTVIVNVRRAEAGPPRPSP